MTNELGSTQKFQECRNSDCQSGQICDPNKDSYVVCRDCKSHTCIACDALGHPGQSCQERLQALSANEAEKSARDAEAAKGQEYVETNCKLCPKCESRGRKEDGCDHITCIFRILGLNSNAFTDSLAGPQCQHQYCWGCLADYEDILREDNGRHGNDCPYRPENLPAAPAGLQDET